MLVSLRILVHLFNSSVSALEVELTCIKTLSHAISAGILVPHDMEAIVP